MFLLLLIICSNSHFICAASSLFSAFLALSCSSLFLCHSPLIIIWKVASLFFLLIFLHECFFLECSPNFETKDNLWLKSYLWNYLLLSGDIFSYKTSIIQLFCPHFFLSHDFRVILNKKWNIEEKVVNLCFVLLKVSFVKWV